MFIVVVLLTFSTNWFFCGQSYV